MGIIAAIVVLYICVTVVSKTFESLGIVLDLGSLGIGVLLTIAAAWVSFIVDGWRGTAARPNHPQTIKLETKETPSQISGAALMAWIRLIIFWGVLIFVLAQLVFTQ